MSSIIKGITDEQSVTKKEPEVHVPGYGTIPLDMLKRHVQSLSKDFNDSIQKGEFLKAAYRSEQFYNALMALAKALPKPNKVDETHSTGTTVGSAGIGGGAGLGIDKSPMEKVLEKPLGEGQVVSMQARKTPLVIAGSPYDWDIYDLRTNKMVANILGGDRHDSPLYEVRINRNGMTKSTRMLPTYVVTSGPDNNPPYKAFELEVPKDRDKIEKSPGPGGTTKLRPDNMDVIAHLAKMTGQGKYYGYDTVLVEEGLDPYELVEKALGAKIMEIDDAMELGYTDVNPEDSSSIDYLGTQKNEDTAYAGGMGQGGNAGQSYRKYKAKPAGTSESSIMKGIQSEGDTGVTRWSKENPPPPELLLNTLIQILMNPNNNKSPQDLISLWNEKYGLKHTLNGLRQYAQNDYKKAELSKALTKAALAYESSQRK